MRNFSLLSPMHGNVQGVLVASVAEDSNAWRSDLHMGDVITSVNQQEIKNVEELKKMTTKTDKKILLHVLRGQSAIFLLINKEEDNTV